MSACHRPTDETPNVASGHCRASCSSASALLASPCALRKAVHLTHHLVEHAEVDPQTVILDPEGPELTSSVSVAKVAWISQRPHFDLGSGPGGSRGNRGQHGNKAGGKTRRFRSRVKRWSGASGRS